MRYCPVCQTTYHNEVLRFCTQDGTELVAAHDSEATLVTPKFPSQPIQVVPLPPPAAPSAYAPPPPPTSSGLGWKIGVVLLAVALAGVLGFVVVRELTRSSSGGNLAQSGQDTPPQMPSFTPKPTPSRAPTPSGTPTPAPALTPQVSAQVQREAEEDITATLNDWVAALEEHNLEEFLSYYADRLEVYYRHRNWSLAQVRADKETAFDQYSEMTGSVSGLRVTVDPSGNRATATFTKSYSFKNDEKDFSGSTRSEMIFVKTTDGRWLIAGERDL